MSKSDFSDPEIAILSFEKGDRFDEILNFANNYRDTLEGQHILWDMTAFEFNNLNSVTLRSVLNQVALLQINRAGRKSAVVVASNLGFGMMRMYQTNAEGELPAQLEIFRAREQALEFLKRKNLNSTEQF